MFVGQIGSYTASLSTDYETFLDKERLIYFLEGSLILSNSGSYGIGSYRTSLESIDYSTQNLIVYSIESAGIYLKLIKRILRYLDIYLSVSHHLGKIANPAKQSIRDTRRTAASHSYFMGCLIVYIYFKDSCASPHDTLEILNVVVFQGTCNSETGSERSSQKTAAGSSSYEGKRI